MSDSFISDILYYKERQKLENIANFFMLSFSCYFFNLDSTFISCEFTFLRVQMQDSLVYYKLSWIFSLLIFREIWHWTISMIYSPKNHQRKKTPFSPRIYLYQDFLSLPSRFYDLRINYKHFLWKKAYDGFITIENFKILQNKDPKRHLTRIET